MPIRRRAPIARVMPDAVRRAARSAVVESLEPRRLLASVGGTVFFDLNDNLVQDPSEPGIPGRAVYLDANRNGRFDPGERLVRTDDDGRWRMDTLPVGRHAFGTIVGADESQTFPRIHGAPVSKFNIELNYQPDVPETVRIGRRDVDVRALFETAARRWEQVITGNLPEDQSIQYAQSETSPRPVDDLLIDVGFGNIDGVGGTLAFAGPQEFRGGGPRPDITDAEGNVIPGSGLPISGLMRFDTSDFDDPVQLYYVILHEMGHVLGIGPLWEGFRLVQPGPQSFNGLAARAEYVRAFNVPRNATVPYEDGTGFEGSDESHWRQSQFPDELMNPFAVVGGRAPLSRVTAASLADLGYRVNVNAADYWQPPTRFARIPNAVGAGWYGRPLRGVVSAYDANVETSGETLSNANFGVRPNLRPQNAGLRVEEPFALAQTFDPLDPDVVVGDPITLRALGVRDRDDAIYAVNFYLESNGQRGLQTTGDNPDTFIAQDRSPDGGWRVQAPTIGLDPGLHTFYARAFDTHYAVTDSVGVARIIAPQDDVPVAPFAVRANAIDTSTVRVDFSTVMDQPGENRSPLRFEVEMAASDSFNRVLRTVRLGENERAFTFDGLESGRTYFFRVRGFNTEGPSEFASTASATTLVRGEVLLDARPRTGTSVTDSGVMKLRGAWQNVIDENAYFGQYARATDTARDAVYQPNLQAAGRYSVFVSYPRQEAGTTGGATTLPVEVYAGNGARLTAAPTIDQTTRGDGFVLLGTYDFAAGTAGFVRVPGTPAASAAGVTTFGGRPVTDAVRFVPASNQVAVAAAATAVSSRSPSPSSFPMPFASSRRIGDDVETVPDDLLA